MILSVFPDDLLAHAGLSAIHEENRELDKAIWHMEQAFETQPSNQTIQDELRRLIGKRDGSEPSKIRLTRGALIRMYAKGELYQQAIAETQSALQAYPDRVDLKLLLAKLLVLSNNQTEAVEICSDILSGSPYCFDANRIMFEVTSTASDVENYDQVYHQRLSELDPYYAYIESATTRIEDVPDDKIILEKPVYLPSEEEIAETPEWASRIGIPWHEKSSTISARASVGEMRASLDSEANRIDESALSTPFIEENDDSVVEEPTVGVEKVVESSDEDLPDWISKAGWIRASEEETATPPSEPEVPASEIKSTSDLFAAQPAEDLPDWLRSLSPEGSDAPQIYASNEQESIPEAAIPPLPPEILAEFFSDENVGPEVFQPKVSTDNSNEKEPVLPEFEKPTDVPLPTSEESTTDLPDWLKDLDSAEFTVNIPDKLSISPETVSELTESAERHETSPIPSADFIEELETSDLIGELDSIIEEGRGKSELLENIEIETSARIPQQETLDKTVEEDLQVAPITEEVEKTEIKPSIPAWVKNILANPASETTVISPTPSQGAGIPTRVVSEEPIVDEHIEELITDLPEASDRDGAISKEVTGELDSWLNELSTEKEHETEPVAAVSKEPESLEDMTAISLEALSELLSEEEIEPAHTDEIEIEAETVLDATEYTSFDDRLSSMLGSEEEQVVIRLEEEATAKEQAAGHIPNLEILTSELKTGDYATLAKDLNYQDLNIEIFDQLLPELNSELEKNPSNYQLWQTLGDIYSKKSNISDAIKAYREAERLLFQ